MKYGVSLLVQIEVSAATELEAFAEAVILRGAAEQATGATHKSHIYLVSLEDDEPKEQSG